MHLIWSFSQIFEYAEDLFLSRVQVVKLLLGALNVTVCEANCFKLKMSLYCGCKTYWGQLNRKLETEN